MNENPKIIINKIDTVHIHTHTYESSQKYGKRKERKSMEDYCICVKTKKYHQFTAFFFNLERENESHIISFNK